MITADAVLRELVEMRLARRAKFVAYDADRRMKRREKELWQVAEQLYQPRPEMPKPEKPKGQKTAA